MGVNELVDVLTGVLVFETLTGMFVVVETIAAPVYIAAEFRNAPWLKL